MTILENTLKNHTIRFQEYIFNIMTSMNFVTYISKHYKNIIQMNITFIALKS